MILEFLNWEIGKLKQLNLQNFFNDGFKISKFHNVPFPISYLILFDFAVLLAAVKIAVNSLASFNKGSILILSVFFVSGNISNQKVDSSASSSTTPILEINSL